MEPIQREPIQTGSIQADSALKEAIRTSDFYEAAYYLSEGIPPEEITCRHLNKNIICDFYFDPRQIGSHQFSYHSSQAIVNLLAFRRSYAEVLTCANQAKREYRKGQKSAPIW